MSDDENTHQRQQLLAAQQYLQDGYLLVAYDTLLKMTKTGSHDIGTIVSGRINYFEDIFDSLRQVAINRGHNYQTTVGGSCVPSQLPSQFQQLGALLSKLFAIGMADLSYNIVKITPAYLSDNFIDYLNRLRQVCRRLLAVGEEVDMSSSSFPASTSLSSLSSDAEEQMVSWLQPIIVDGIKYVPLTILSPQSPSSMSPDEAENEAEIDNDSDDVDESEDDDDDNESEDDNEAEDDDDNGEAEDGAITNLAVVHYGVYSVGEQIADAIEELLPAVEHHYLNHMLATFKTAGSIERLISDSATFFEQINQRILSN